MTRSSTNQESRKPLSAQTSGIAPHAELQVIFFDASRKEDTIDCLRGLVTDGKGRTLLAPGKAREIIEGKAGLKNISAEKAEEIRAELTKLGAKVGILSADEVPEKPGKVIFCRESFQPGKYITFGHYPQTSEEIDNTPIEWLVLDVQENKALLLSRFGLDSKPYNTEITDNNTWEMCSLRNWLNSEFLMTAFDSRMRRAILPTDVNNDSTQGYFSTDGGNNTQDRIFLLSYAQLIQYFGNRHETMYTTPTDYAIKHGAKNPDYYETLPSELGWWWLRSPGRYSSRALLVDSGGDVYNHDVSLRGGAVRPAVWLDLNVLPGISELQK